jgi:glutathione synthase/RimK-type ligase-like ATP-grasp enzyme
MSKWANVARLKILVFATQNNPLAARISLALAGVGFHVAAITAHGHPLRKARKITHHFTYDARFGLASITRAIDRWNPDFLVCTDDFAVMLLQALHQRMAASRNKAARQICDLIELSLGPTSSFSATRNKSDFLALAEHEGLRCPQTSVIPAARAFEPAHGKLSYPVVVKADHSDGGRCVRVVENDVDLRTAVWELQTPCTWRCRRFFGAVLGSDTLSLLMLPLRRTISLQQYVAGRPANRAVVCWKGKVLAGISVEAVEVTHAHGPASVVRLMDHPEMATACERMVRRLNLSGFVGFDFIVDAANRAWLLEMNARVTQISHFLLADGTNLAGALYTQMKRQLPWPGLAPIHGELIALFPNEMIRSPSSSYVRSCQYDVPWEEPELVRAVLNQVLRTGIRKRARSLLEVYFPALAGSLVKLGIIDARTASYALPHLEEVTPPL